MTRTPTSFCAAISTAIFTTLVLAGCEPNQSTSAQSPSPTTAQATTVKDLEAQLTRQIREQWPSEQLSGVRIQEFAPPVAKGAVQIVFDIRWVSSPEDTHVRSLGTGMTLYRVASDYLVGTLKHNDPDKAPVNVILKFR
jgi:hypothetical protein